MKNFAENNILKKMADAKKKFFLVDRFSHTNEFFIYVSMWHRVFQKNCVFFNPLQTTSCLHIAVRELLSS